MRAVFLLLLPMLAGPVVRAQRADSVTLAALDEVYLLAVQNPDSAIAVAGPALARAEKINDLAGEAYSLKALGMADLHKGRYDSCYRKLRRAAGLFTRLKDTSKTLDVLLTLSTAYSNASRLAETTATLLEADSIARRTSNEKARAVIAGQMGIVYRQRGEYPQAIVYLKQAIAIHERLHDTVHVASSSGSLAILYESLHQPDSALFQLNRSMPNLEKMKGFGYEKAMGRERYGDAYFAQEKFDRALEYYLRSYNFFQTTNDPADQAFEAMNVGKVFAKLHQYADAERFMLLSYHLDDSLQMPAYATDAADALTDFYASLKNWEKAYVWQGIARKWNDSVDGIQQRQQTVELQTRYETAKKDNEISLLRKDADLKKAELQRQQAIRLGLLFGTGLLLAIVGLAINRYRTIQKSRQLLAIEKLRNSIARDLHDDIGSTLSSIHINSKMALNPAAESHLVKNQLEKIREYSGRMMEGMSDIVWAINPVNDSLEKMIVKMKEFAVDMLEPQNIRFDFQSDPDTGGLVLDARRRKEMYMIYKEVINNAARHSRAENISIRLDRNKSFLQLSIADDGRGFDRNNGRVGNGLSNLTQRAESVGGEVTVETAPGKGTVVRLHMPIA